MKCSRNVGIALIAIAVTTGSLLAQAQKPQSTHSTELHAHEHETADLIQGAREQCQMAVLALNELTRALSGAKESNDLAAMRAALVGTERPLARTQQNLGVCVDVLKMIQAPQPSGESAQQPAEHLPPVDGRRDMPHASTTGDAIDPVCNMKVDTKTAPTRVYQSKTYYFCSQHDRAAFDREPARYVDKKPK